MKWNGMRVAILGTAVATVPAFAMGQTSSPMGGGSSPNMPNQTRTQPEGMNTPQAGPATPGDSMKDKMFVRKAMAGGLAEVQMGQLAAQKGSSDQVKSFGQKMVDDHTKLNQQMMPIAEQMGVKTPAKLEKKDQAEYDKLNGLAGAEFDKEYLSFMVKDHHKDLEAFRAEMGSTQDPTLKTAVQQGAQVIDQHAQMVDTLAQQNGISVPKRDVKAANKPM